MISLQTLENSANAIAKAKELNPTVTCYQLCDYMVAGSKADYQVKFKLDDAGICQITCACPSGDFDNPCYHAAAALELHREISDAHYYANERFDYEQRQYFEREERNRLAK